MKAYARAVPPCGVFCGGCPRYLRGKTGCLGAHVRCAERRCKTFYVCCVEKRRLRHCHECPRFPCAAFKRFAASWEQYGQDLVANQLLLREKGEAAFLEEFNESAEENR